MDQQQIQSMPFGWPMTPFIPQVLPPVYPVCFPSSDDDLFINNRTIIGPPGPPGPPGPAGPPGTPGLVPVTDVVSATYTALPTDYFLCVLTIAQVVITLPLGITGTTYVIKDCSGNASSTSPIIVQGTGQNVDIGTATINTPFGSITVVFNGVDWSII